ncbi:hypothetical protein OUZ56_021132 [Daphnia magna]|uniref:Uncharacterized protein n=1 Tax=Daphnia magna TaxID=35525 RepID=A0ABQ9ZGH5_9CRUS|nr:hypothetical protein OUZ56_021132 [Daphnia magna]
MNQFVLDSIKGPVELGKVSWKLEIINYPGLPIAINACYILKMFTDLPPPMLLSMTWVLKGVVLGPKSASKKD